MRLLKLSIPLIILFIGIWYIQRRDYDRYYEIVIPHLYK